MRTFYTCSFCAFTGHVVGGEDRNASPPTVTIYCDSCVELQDVAYEGWVEGKLAVPLCGNHAEHSVRLWRKHHLCPRCLCGAMRPPNASTGGA